jgi:hypothetical protein
LTLNNPVSENVAILTFTRDRTAASGSVAYTGLPFKPSKILSASQSHVINYGSFGGCVEGIGSDFCLVAIVAVTYTRPYLLLSSDVVDNVEQRGVVASYDADGITIAWTKAGAPGAGTMICRLLCVK